MKKYAIIIFVLAALVVGYFLVSPLFIEVKVEEAIEDIMSATPGEEGVTEQEIAEIAAGTFEGLGGHSAQGTAKLIRVADTYYVRFEDDFRVTNGPDLFVYFGKDGAYVAEARLAALKGNMGSQNYEVPEGINSTDYNEVWVWCRAFSVPFGKAELK